jgi:uncharacterized protein with HEPN domain
MGVDLEIIWEIIEKNLDELKVQIEEIINQI